MVEAFNEGHSEGSCLSGWEPDFDSGRSEPADAYEEAEVGKQEDDRGSDADSESLELAGAAPPPSRDSRCFSGTYEPADAGEEKDKEAERKRAAARYV